MSDLGLQDRGLESQPEMDGLPYKDTLCFAGELKKSQAERRNEMSVGIERPVRTELTGTVIAKVRVGTFTAAKPYLPPCRHGRSIGPAKYD